METFLKADIFFFIVAIESVVLTLLVSVVLLYLIKTMRELSRVSASLRERVTESETYLAELKERLDGNFLFRFVFPMRKKTRKEMF